MKVPADMTQTHVVSLRQFIVESMFDLDIPAGVGKKLLELTDIALVALMDCYDLRAANQARCPGCNHYTTVGHVCDYCGADVDRS